MGEETRFGPAAVPLEIRYLQEEKILEVDWDSGDTARLPAELLRVESPSAEVQGHAPSQKKLIHGRRHVGIINIEPVGTYAIRIVFDDLHDSGLFSWQYLLELHRNQEQLWRDYLAALAERGLSRDP